MLEISCQHCGKKFSAYPSADRRFCSPKCGSMGHRIHSRELVLKIVTELGETTTGTILKLYNRYHSPISLRHLRSLLRELETEGKAKLKVVKMRHGRTTIVKAVFLGERK